MSKLIILTTIALERPDRSVACEFFYCKDEDVSTKIKEIKDRVINECIEAWQEGTGEPIGNCKFKDGYVKGLKSKSNFAKKFRLD